MIKSNLQLIVFTFLISTFFSCRESVNNPKDTGNGLEPPPAFGPGLTFVSPTEGDNWQPGSMHEIKWDVIANEFKVDILLYRKTEFRLIIADSVANKGSYMWRVPAEIARSHHYRIHIAYSLNPYQSSFISNEFYVID